MTVLPPLPDDSHIRRISSALWSRAGKREAAVLVGAGFSANAIPLGAGLTRMPSWNDLSRTIIRAILPGDAPTTVRARDLLESQIGATSTSLRVAQEFEVVFGRDALDRQIQLAVPDRHFGPGELHQALLQLPWADVLTTNWDTLLERGADRLDDQVYDVVRTVQDIPTARAPRIVKLHGSLPSQRPFILTEEDFRTYPERFAPFINLARQAAMENALVLLGFSGEDPNFLFWSGWVRDQLGAHAPTIYLVGVLELEPSRRKMLEGRRIQPIDLAHLAPSIIGSGDGRHALATRWFLERLLAAKPYRLQNWPSPSRRPRAATSAGLPSDPVGPRREPHAPNSARPVVDQVTDVIEVWRHNRQLYPGWLIAPSDQRRAVWDTTVRWIDPILKSLAEMPRPEATEALYELNWRYELALVPLRFDLAESLIAFTSRLVAVVDQLSARERECLFALAFATVRHAREEGDDAQFEHWASWIDRSVGVQGNERVRLIYEKALWCRSRFDLDALEECLTSWVDEGDPFWLVRKSGLLAEIGKHDEAERLSREALSAIRQKTAKGSDDFWSWSRESYALFLRSAFAMHERLEGNTLLDQGTWWEHVDRDDQLRSRGCDGKRDFFSFVNDLDHEPTPLKSQVEQRRGFDVGVVGIRLRFGMPDPMVERLIAFQALRFQEESGLPAYVGKVRISSQIILRSSVWLLDVAPFAAVTAFLQASATGTDDNTEHILSRFAVATLPLTQAEQMTNRLVRLSTAMVSRLPLRKQHLSLPHVRLRMVLEALSRVVTRAQSQARAVFDTALLLCRETCLLKTHGLETSLEVLLSRALEVMEVEERRKCLPLAFQLPLPGQAGVGTPDSDPTSRIVLSRCPIEWAHSAWPSVIDHLIRAASDEGTRQAAVRRLSRLYHHGALNELQTDAFADAVWRTPRTAAGLPASIELPPSAFTSLPQPIGRPAHQYARQQVMSAGFSLREGDNLGLALAVIAARDELGLSERDRLHLLERFQQWLTSIELSNLEDASFGDDLRVRASLAFADFAELAVGLEGGREILQETLRINQVAYLQPALPVLTSLGLVSETAAADSIRDALLHAPGVHGHLAANAVFAWTKRGGSTELLGDLWESVGMAIVARSDALVQALQVAGFGYRRYTNSIPPDVDKWMVQGLKMILLDAEATSPPSGHDKDSVRRWGAALAVSMQSKGRGGEDLLRPWQDAVSSDPLGVIKWGIATAEDLECAGR